VRTPLSQCYYILYDYNKDKILNLGISQYAVLLTLRGKEMELGFGILF
jgi:hypothetical protein